MITRRGHLRAPSTRDRARVRHSDRMRRRTLPLLLAALLTASGCVTVSGPGAGDAKPSAARPTGPGAPPAAWPLTALPASSGPAPAAPAAAGPEKTAPDAGGQRPEPLRGTDSDASRPAAEHRAGHRPRANPVPEAKPRPKARPKAEPKRRAPGSKPPAPQRGGPAHAPGRVDMSELCRSSQGVTSPAITQLCNGTYARAR